MTIRRTEKSRIISSYTDSTLSVLLLFDILGLDLLISDFVGGFAETHNMISSANQL